MAYITFDPLGSFTKVERDAMKIRIIQGQKRVVDDCLCFMNVGMYQCMLAFHPLS